MLKVSRNLALVVGMALPAIETWRRWPVVGDWPAWLDDFIAGVLLLFAWWAGRQDVRASRPYLMAGWGYTFGIAYMSFFGQLRVQSVPDPSGFPMAFVLAFKGFGMALAAGCLAMAWFGKETDAARQ